LSPAALGEGVLVFAPAPAPASALTATVGRGGALAQAAAPPITPAAAPPPIPLPPRAIRSFVRREGRLTAAQGRALDAASGGLLLPVGAAPLDPAALFGRHAPLGLEIGCGAGESLLHAARRHPEMDFLGVEVYRPGLGRLLQALDQGGIPNARVLCQDAVEVLHRLPLGCLSEAWAFFPDPWPKKRHHKRRLIQPGFVRLLAGRMRRGGRLRLATDLADYAEAMLAAVAGSGLFLNGAGPGRWAPRPETRPVTRYEARAHRLGHTVHDLAFLRNDTPIAKPD
jgi:tRNA (guanine-N7-)-methyltransferase